MKANRNFLVFCIFCLQTVLVGPPVYAAPGDLDLTFSQDGKLYDFLRNGGDDAAQGSAIQRDGKIVAVGEISFGEIKSCGIARYNPDGTVDISFGTKGTFVFPTGISAVCNAVTIQADDKIVAGGFTTIGTNRNALVIRLNPDGSLDTSFDSDGIIITELGSDDDEVMGLAIQGNKIVLTADAGEMSVVRYNADGSLDTSFSSDGKAYTNFIFNPDAFAVVIQSDDRILICGRSETLTSPRSDFALARFNNDGSPDTSFDGDGMLTMRVGVSDSLARSVALQSDGKIVASGYAFPPLMTELVYLSFAAVRLNPDGSPDFSFDGDGIALPNLTDFHDLATGLAIQNDGRIVLSGLASNGGGAGDSVGLVRLTTDGAYDNTFNANGRLVRQGPEIARANSLSLQADGKLITAGRGSFCCGSREDFMLIRFNTDGTPDNSFSSDSLLNHNISLRQSIGSAIAKYANGKFVVAGTDESSGLTDSSAFGVIRYNADGTRDVTFGSDGRVFTEVTPAGDVVRAVAVQPDGKVLVAGYAGYPNVPPGSSDMAILRYNNDGTLDETFDGDGKVIVDMGSTESVTGMAIQPDGKIVTTGNAWNGGNAAAVFLRLNTDGSFDNSFDMDGKAIISGPETHQPEALVLQPDGKIVAVGSAYVSNYDILAIRLNSDGSPDNSFDGDGKVLIPVGTVSERGDAVALQPDGKIVIAGTIFNTGNADFAVVRLNTNGTPDMTFDFDGKLTTSILATDNAKSVVIQQNGKIIVGGASSTSTTLLTADLSMVRYNSNGTLDNSFNLDGRVTIDLWGSSDDLINAMVLDRNGRVLIAGQSIGLFAVARVEGDFIPSRTRFDFEGDGKADVSVYRPSTGVWYQLFSSNIPYGSPVFGISGDVPIPADFDGDGKTDTAIYRPSNGDWWYRTSSDGVIRYASFGGQVGDVALSADVNGDGTDDFIIYRPSNGTWYRLTTTGAVDILPFGAPGDTPVIGDFDGDGKADPAIFRPSAGDWWYASSAVPGSYPATHWGQNGDVPAPADFDGDGKTDFAVFRPSNGGWYVVNSGNQSYTIVGFGLNEDRPAPADYDGDGRADIAVFRPSTGVWYLLQSTSGFAATQWGLSTDVAIPNAFVHP